MIWLGLGLTTMAIGGIWFAPKLSRQLFLDRRAKPELPCAFGHRMTWIAVRTRNTARLIECLDLTDARSVGWSVGVSSVYHQKLGLERVFITPPVEGWSCVVSLALPYLMDEAYEDRFTKLLEELSVEFGEAYYFSNLPPLSYYAWAAAYNGTIVRAFAHGVDGPIWNRGAVSADEALVAPGLFTLRAVSRRVPAISKLDENHVIELARRWSMDPTRFDQRHDLEAGVGYLASAPTDWRPRVESEAA